MHGAAAATQLCYHEGVEIYHLNPPCLQQCSAAEPLTSGRHKTGAGPSPHIRASDAKCSQAPPEGAPPPPPKTGMTSGAGGSLPGAMPSDANRVKRKLASLASAAGLASLLQGVSHRLVISKVHKITGLS